MKKYRYNILIFWLLMLTTIACQTDYATSSRVESLPYFNDPTFTPIWISPTDTDVDTLHTIAPFTLTDQDGQAITKETFSDKIYVVDFFFTACPGICPKLTSNMGVIQDEFIEDDDILLLSHSVTPERDSVAVLKNYADDKGIVSNKWHLATGDRDTIYHLGRYEYFIEEDLGLEKEADEFLHTENFVLIDHNSHIRGIYNGLNKTSVNQLVSDIHTLKKEL